MSSAAEKLFELVETGSNPVHPTVIEVTRAAFPLKLDIIFRVTRTVGGIVAIGKAGPAYYSTWIKREGDTITGGHCLVIPRPGMKFEIPGKLSFWQRIRAAFSRAWG